MGVPSVLQASIEQIINFDQMMAVEEKSGGHQS